MNDKISLFGGTGFILGNFAKLYPDLSYIEPRESLNPKYNNILYGCGTTTNYTIFEDASKDVRDNLLLFTDTLKNLKKEDIVNLLSSWFVFGANNKSQNEKMDENDFCNPKGFYAITKLCQEQLLESYCKTFGIKYRIFRLCNVIGGDQNANAKKNALEFLIEKLKRDEEVTVYEGDNYRNYLHVTDVCRAMKLIIDSGKANEIWNIGQQNSFRLIDIIDYCKERLNSKSEIKVIPQPDFHKQVQVVNFHMNIEKLNALGFYPEYNMMRIMDELCDIKS